MREHPAVRGIVEHLDRATLFDSEARAAPGPTVAFRHWIAAVYFLRAAVELMRETAIRGELIVDLAQMDGVIVPGHMQLEFQLRLPALGQGNIHFRVNPSRPGLRCQISDGSRNYKYFLTSGFLVQDHLEPRPILLPRLVDEQLRQLPKALHAFVQVLRSLAVAGENLLAQPYVVHPRTRRVTYAGRRGRSGLYVTVSDLPTIVSTVSPDSAEPKN